jgi:hypothetical protein
LRLQLRDAEEAMARRRKKMLCRLVVVLALSGADALNLGAAASRRSFITKAAAAAGSLAVAAPVFAESKDSLTLAGKGGMTGTRAAYQDDVRGGASAGKSGKSGIVTKNSFDGTFTDTAGLSRKISWVGNRDYQIDGDGKLPAKKANANTLIADFSSKGGPSAVTVKSLANGDIFFPDGSVWKKL